MYNYWLRVFCYLENTSLDSKDAEELTAWEGDDGDETLKKERNSLKAVDWG